MTARRDRAELLLDNRRNMDQLDFASDLQDTLNRRGVELARQAAQPEAHPDFDGKHCLDCGNEIPEKRLELQRIRCIACQQAKEKKR